LTLYKGRQWTLLEEDEEQNHKTSPRFKDQHLKQYTFFPFIETWDRFPLSYAST
jgi:hypothetical protein